MRLFPKCLTYGMWGGPGWSGGEWQDNPLQVKWGVAPIDSMDVLFKCHDFDMQNNIPKPHTSLYKKLLDIDNPPAFWGKCYRYGAIAIFWVMSKFE